MGFLLSLIPGPWLAVLKRVPWRIVGYVLVAALAIWLVLMVNGWRVDSNRLEATEKALERRTAKLTACQADASAQQAAFTAAATKAKQTEAADRAATERIQHDLEQRLAAAAASSSDLSRRLHDYEKRRCSSTLSSVAGTPGQPPAPGSVAGSEEGTGAAIDAAHDRYHATCDLDAIAADGWWAWWQSVQPNH